MEMLDVYLYGMTVWSTIHLLDGLYPEADSYREIKETYTLPGGETGNSALVLAKLGLKVRIDGPFLGTTTRAGIIDFYSKYRIDCSGLHFDPSFEGVQDLVLIDKNTRTVFGKFGQYFSGEKRWTKPDEAAIRAANIVAVDPFFGNESVQVAAYCVKSAKKYVTIDCRPESELCKNATVTVISNEYLRNEFTGTEDPRRLLELYTNATNGLVIFTFGGREILYCRKGGGINSILPYQVEVKSTLGAGDTFRAGVVYGVLNGWDDQKVVKFAAATASSVCTRFPMALDPPGLEEIMKLMSVVNH